MTSRSEKESSISLSVEIYNFAKHFIFPLEHILLFDGDLNIISKASYGQSGRYLRYSQLQNWLLEYKSEIEKRLNCKGKDKSEIIWYDIRIDGHDKTLWLFTRPLLATNEKKKTYLGFLGKRKKETTFGERLVPEEEPLGECLLNTNFEIIQCQSLEKQFNDQSNVGKHFFALFDSHFVDYILQTLINCVKGKQASTFLATLADSKNTWVNVKVTPVNTNQIHVVIFRIIQHRSNTISSSELFRSLVDVGIIFSQATNLKQAIDKTLEHIRSVLKLHSLSIFQDDSANEQFILVHSSVYKKMVNTSMIESFPYDFSLGFKKILEKNQPIVSSSIYAGLPNEIICYLESVGIKAYAVIPIFIAGRFYGAMIVAHLRHKHWKQDEIEYLLACASMLGLNIDRELNRMELIESRNDFINIFNSAADMVFIINFSGNIIEANQSATSISGFSYQELLGKSINSLTTSSYDIEPIMAGEVHQSQQLLTGTILITKDGRHIPIEVRERIIRYRGQKSILTVARDISERKSIDRLIFKTILETEERERKRIAETIHDDLAPLLSALKIYLNLFANQKIDQASEHEVIPLMQQILDQAIETAKNTAVEMMPNLLTHFGMVEAITDFVQKINRTKAVRIKLSIYPETFSIDPISGRILFGVVKELINNTLKHDPSANVEIEILKQKERLIILYKENGRGFNFYEKLRSENSGLGLKNIVNKIESLSGQIIFNRTDEKGFEIKIVVPVTENQI
ncbi:MAG TPA: PAS domain S-box protein [Salinivirgaceae bacterium]|nr:PAS domain S-box protein [Salinivirgaceae bacterium]